MKSDAARKYLQKKQLERGGVGNGYYKVQARTTDARAPDTVTKADGQIRTIYDMIDYYYGFVPEFANKNSGGGMAKADDPVLGGSGGATQTPGYRNAVYGSEVYSILNFEVNAYALLENRAWTKSGERIITEYANPTEGTGGVGENATLPDTDHPDIAQFEQEAKTVAHSFDVSQVKQLLADTQDDDLDDPFDFLRRYFGEGTEQQTGMGEHPKKINEMLLNKPADAGDDDLLSLDQLISDGSEVANTSVSSADVQVYGFDRSSNEFESNVLHGTGGDNRVFTINLLDDAIRAVKNASGKNPVQDDNYFFLTNHDTYQRIEEEVGGKERLEAQRASVGMNGVQTNDGDDVGITVNSYKSIPIFESQDVPTDGIGRVYLVDSSTLFMKTLLPTQFYSTGTEVNEDPYSIDRLGNEGLYVTIGETTIVSPDAHAKVRDLQ